MDVAILDTCVILRYTNDEYGAESVEKILDLITKKRIAGIISAAVLAEIFAILYKTNALDRAIEILDYLRNIGVIFADVNTEIAILSGIFKGKYSTARKGFSYGDGIVLATAFIYSGCVLTYDSEFDRITDVEILTPEKFLSKIRE